MVITRIVELDGLGALTQFLFTFAAKDGGGKDNDWLNLSTKSNHSSSGGGGGAGESEGDAPLNLSLKTGGDAKMDSASPGNSLQSLSSITAALGGSSGGASGGGKSNDRSGKYPWRSCEGWMDGYRWPRIPRGGAKVVLQ